MSEKEVRFSAGIAGLSSGRKKDISVVPSAGIAGFSDGRKNQKTTIPICIVLNGSLFFALLEVI